MSWTVAFKKPEKPTEMFSGSWSFSNRQRMIEFLIEAQKVSKDVTREGKVVTVKNLSLTTFNSLWSKAEKSGGRKR